MSMRVALSGGLASPSRHAVFSEAMQAMWGPAERRIERRQPHVEKAPFITRTLPVHDRAHRRLYFFSVQGTTAMALISIRYSGFVNPETCTSVLAG